MGGEGPRGGRSGGGQAVRREPLDATGCCVHHRPVGLGSLSSTAGPRLPSAGYHPSSTGAHQRSFVSSGVSMAAMGRAWCCRTTSWVAAAASLTASPPSVLPSSCGDVVDCLLTRHTCGHCSYSVFSSPVMFYFCQQTMISILFERFGGCIKTSCSVTRRGSVYL